MPIRALIIVLLALAALAPSSHAAGGKTLDGITIQGWDIALGLSDSGAPVSWKVGPQGFSCNKASLETRKVTIRDFDQTSATSFADDSKLKERYGKYKIRSTLHIDGTLDDLGWLGEFRRVSTVIRNGRTIDTCKLWADWWTFTE